MAVTPEGKIKRMVGNVLAEFKEMVQIDGFSVPNMDEYWPVPSGFGESHLDCLVCYFGRAIYIETKATGKLPTPRQQLRIAQCKAAGGIVLVIDSKEDVEALRLFLQVIKDAATDNR